MTDSLLYQGARKELVETLKNKGITDLRVLNAMAQIPRHLFVESCLSEKAYLDIPLVIGYQQTISQPFTVALQSQLLNIQKNDKVLEIGTGSGYQAAVLSKMGAKVFSIERQHELFKSAKEFLHDYDFSIAVHFGDGFRGLKLFAPYDKILVTCGAPFIPDALLKQLKTGGIMVIPVGETSQVMYRITKTSETEFSQETFGNCKFVPMLEREHIIA